MIVNYLAVLVAALVAMIVGSFWYSPLLFGKQWQKLRGIHVDTANMKMPAREVILEFICTLITAYVLDLMSIAFFAHTVYLAFVLAFIIWLGFYATMLLAEVLW